MSNPIHISNWADQAVAIWTASEIKLQPGIAADQIRNFQTHLDFNFPADFIELYQKTNGFEDSEWNANLFSLWSLEKIVKEYQENNNKDYIWFCDYLIFSHTIGFNKNDNKIYKSYSLKEPIPPELVTDSFEEFIYLLNEDDIKLH